MNSTAEPWVPGLKKKSNMLTNTINRSGLIAWSPKFESNPLIAIGAASENNLTDIISKSTISLLDLSTETPFEVVSINVMSSFQRILWTSVEASYKDLIVGSFDDGRIELYDTQMLINGETDGVIQVAKLHSGAVKGLCSSGVQPNLIATGGINGEIALWDLNNIQKAALMSFKKCERFANVTDLAWNPKVSHIIAAASDSGVVSIIDLRSKKEVTTICLPNFDRVSSISWNPESPTSIAVATSANSQACVYLWDLKNSSSPKEVFKGHSKGVNSLEWCPKDSKMILSAGNDSKVLCWNPDSDEIIKEYHGDIVYDVKWCPSDPNIFGMSTSTNTKIHSINEFHHDQEGLEDNDYQNIPKWFTCPIGASFGGSNICSIFHSNSQRVSCLTPKIDLISCEFEKLSEFERTASQGSLIVACNMIIDDEKLSYLNLACRILKSVSSPNGHADFLEFINEIHHDQEYLIDRNLNAANNTAIISESSNFDADNVSDKIVRCDFEGAMVDCLNTGRFTEALIIATCGGSDLQLKAEKFISERNYCLPINLALSISRRDFLSLVSNGPIYEWYRIFKVIFENAEPSSLLEAAGIFSRRLLDSNLHKHALLFLVAAGNLEQFLKIVLDNSMAQLSVFEIGGDEFVHIIRAYQLIRILEALRPNFVKDLTSDLLKITIFEITIKLKYLMHYFGFKTEIATNFFENDFYQLHLKSKNSELDSFIEYLQNSDDVHNQTADYKSFERLSLKVSNEPKIDSGISQNNSTFSNVDTSPKLFASTSSLGKVPNPNYNDVPIINSKLSKLSPHLHLNSNEIKSDDVHLGLNTLFNFIESKSGLEFSGRIVQECMKKLSSEFICSKQYSELVKPFIASLFIKLAESHFENSAVLASNILASFFVETKDWILPLKRLIEIAKAQK